MKLAVCLENVCFVKLCKNGECVLGLESDEFTCNCRLEYFGYLCQSVIEGEYKFIILLILLICKL